MKVFMALIVSSLIFPAYALTHSKSDSLLTQMLSLTKDTTRSWNEMMSAEENVSDSDANFAYLNQQPNDFREAKRWLKVITKRYDVRTFYAGCPIDVRTTKNGYLAMDANAQRCGVNIYKNAKRSTRAEAEHISPASYFGHSLPCWQQGGRKHCRKVSKAFNIVEADPLNLQYALGNINADRSNYRFVDLVDSRGAHDYLGNGDVLFDDRNNLFDPPEVQKGMIGRTYLYMSEKYGVRLSSNDYQLMKRWAKKKPSKWECTYNELVKRQWGYDNRFTSQICG